MAYSVKTELKESMGPFPPGMRINKKLRWNVYRVKADSFLELITGIDEIEEKILQTGSTKYDLGNTYLR